MLELTWKQNKTLFRNLLQIRGISHTTALKLCAFLGVSPHTKYSELSSTKLDRLNFLLNLYKKKSYPFLLSSISDLDVESTSNLLKKRHISPLANPLGTALLEFKKANIIENIKINSLKGRRFKFGYPIHGQRTRCNAQTARKLNRIKI